MVEKNERAETKLSNLRREVEDFIRSKEEMEEHTTVAYVQRPTS